MFYTIAPRNDTRESMNQPQQDTTPPAIPAPAVPKGRLEQCAWSCHPLREESTLKSVLLSATISMCAAVMAVGLGSPVYGIISLIVLVAAMLGYLLPTDYLIDSEGASWKLLVWRRRRWATFRRVVRHPDGLFLSSFRQPHRLDSFRGVFLRFGAGVDGDEIDSLVRAHVG